MADLARFRAAQDAAHGGFATALAELRAGRKRSHWIWYVFPQLAGLGHSPMAMHYALAGVAEAAAYLRDPVLGERLVTAAAVVREQLGAGVPLESLMGSQIDALKLVSCLTLFEAVATHARASVGADAETGARIDAIATHARAILAAAAAQGYVRCAFTERALARRD